MTRPSKSSLVLDGSEVKLRLEAERVATQTPVHVDWVRFTCIRRNSPALSVDTLFPKKIDENIWDEETRIARFNKLLAQLPGNEFEASSQAYELAIEVAQALGPDYQVNPEIKKGHDFYKFRWPIERNGAECAWVGFLASGDSPQQKSQSATIHANIFGAACTFAATGWNNRIADIVDSRDGDLTRADLALDFFDGLPGGIEGIRLDYMAGLCDVGGKRLKCNQIGDWCNDQERSFYFGSKEAGKQTNAYEKGDQLFGPKANSDWLRVELRYGNKLRILPSAMLRRPADFFAGASDWHAATLLKADCIASAEPVKTTGRLPLMTVEAEAVRSLTWCLKTAAPTIAAMFKHAGDSFIDLLALDALPSRLQRFSAAELTRAFKQALERNQTVDSSPAFA